MVPECAVSWHKAVSCVLRLRALCKEFVLNFVFDFARLALDTSGT